MQGPYNTNIKFEQFDQRVKDHTPGVSNVVVLLLRFFIPRNGLWLYD